MVCARRNSLLTVSEDNATIDEYGDRKNEN